MKLQEANKKTVYELRDGRYSFNPEKSIVYEVCESLKDMSNLNKKIKLLLSQFEDNITEYNTAIDDFKFAD